VGKSLISFNFPLPKVISQETISLLLSFFHANNITPSPMDEAPRTQPNLKSHMQLKTSITSTVLEPQLGFVFPSSPLVGRGSNPNNPWI
jgi:hypothetical protein